MNRTVLFVAGVAGVVALAAARSRLRMPPPEPPAYHPPRTGTGWCPAPPAEYDVDGRGRWLS